MRFTIIMEAQRIAQKHPNLPTKSNRKIEICYKLHKRPKEASSAIQSMRHPSDRQRSMTIINH